jgi:2-desacetyl-2-hydroxyethyl bacteriochlorophyllide A dehydrogenase
MKAGIYQGVQEIVIQEIAYASPAPGFVIVETKRTGICGSDLHHYFGHWQTSTTFAAGHETTGVVAEIGAGVTGVKPGDRVVIEPFIHCGQCIYCRTGDYNHCLAGKWHFQHYHGGFAEVMTVHASQLFVLPDNMSFEQGALVEPLAVAYRAVNQSGATYGDRVAIIGGGTIGLLCLAVVKATRVADVLITVKYAQQERLAREFGADHVVQIAETDVSNYVTDLSSGLGMDCVIETAGSGQAFNDALAIVRPRGSVVLVAGYSGSVEVDLGPIVWKEPMITGSLIYTYDGLRNEFQAAIDLIATGRVAVSKLVTHCFPLAQIGQAFQTAADKKSGAVKVQLAL